MARRFVRHKIASLSQLTSFKQRVVEAWAAELVSRYRLCVHGVRLFLRLPGPLPDPPLVSPRFAIGRNKAHIIISIAPPGVVHPYAGINIGVTRTLDKWTRDHKDWVKRVALRVKGTHPFTHQEYDVFLPLRGAFLKKLFETTLKIRDRELLERLCNFSYKMMMKEIQKLPADKQPSTQHS